MMYDLKYDDVCSLLSCPPERGGVGRGGRSKKGRLDWDSDAGRGHPNSVRDVGCEELEKTLTVIWWTNLQEGQRGLGTSPILSR